MAKGQQVAGLEEADEEPDRDVGGDAGEEAADEGLAADAVAEGAEQVGELVDAGGEDDRRGQQEREAGGVLVVEAAGEAADHGDAGAADPGEQRGDLGDADRRPP